MHFPLCLGVQEPSQVVSLHGDWWLQQLFKLLKKFKYWSQNIPNFSAETGHWGTEKQAVLIVYLLLASLHDCDANVTAGEKPQEIWVVLVGLAQSWLSASLKLVWLRGGSKFSTFSQVYKKLYQLWYFHVVFCIRNPFERIYFTGEDILA